jgi:hypothetical protein
LNINLSTKFSDWIETDLLKFDRDELVSLVFDKYSVDEKLLLTGRIRIVGQETTRLTKEKPSGTNATPGGATTSSTWKLEDLDADAEELNVEKINTAVSTLDELKLMGVRPKSAELRDYLIGKSEDFNAMEMVSKGYFPTSNKLYSNEGEVIASTNKGVVYELKFGQIFTGTEFELESGLEQDSKKAKADANEKAAGDESATEKSDDAKADDAKADDDKAGKKSGRYLFVMVHFDEKLLGPKPEKPEPPVEVADDKPAETTKDAASDVKKEANKNSKDEADDEDDPAAKADDKKPGPDKPDAKADNPPAAEKKDSAETKSDSKPGADDDKPAESKNDEKPPESKPDPKNEYDAALKKYEADLKTYEEKVKAGKDEVTKLNRKFADWYYVIPADSFDKLRLSRKDIVKEKAKPAESKPDETKPATEKPSDDKPEPDKAPESKPANKKPDGGKPEETTDDKPKSDEKPADKKPAAKDE